MATVKQFEDLRVWQLAREAVNDVYKYTQTGSFSKDFALLNQIRRSAISVLSNIAEGFESGSDAKFANYLRIAKGSSGECRAQLYLAYDLKYITDMEFDILKSKFIANSKQLAKFEIYLRNNSNNQVNDYQIDYE